MNETFRLTEQHIRLLRVATIVHNEEGWLGHPGFDKKRPFGSGDITEGMAEILGVPTIETDTEGTHYPKGTGHRMRQIYSELATALQIVLCTGTFLPGIYKQKSYREWELK